MCVDCPWSYIERQHWRILSSNNQPVTPVAPSQIEFNWIPKDPHHLCSLVTFVVNTAVVASGQLYVGAIRCRVSVGAPASPAIFNIDLFSLSLHLFFSCYLDHRLPPVTSIDNNAAPPPYESRWPFPVPFPVISSWILSPCLPPQKRRWRANQPVSSPVCVEK